MKTRSLSRKLIVVALLFCGVSCNKNVVLPIRPSERDLSQSTKADLMGYVSTVDEKDIESYLKYKEILSNQRGEDLIVRNIEKVFSSLCESYAYIINYDEGWEIISGNKCQQPVIAFSENGNLSFDDCPEVIKGWINSMISSKTIEKNYLETIPCYWGKDVDEANVFFWQAISSDPLFITQRMPIGTKGIHDGIIPFDPSGHWELAGIDEETVYEGVLQHLIPLNWHQESPFNNYCPYWNASSSFRCVAGCVPVAGAQLLYYLHNQTGYPEAAPSSGSISGYAQNNSYVQSFSNINTQVWGQMANSPALAAALVDSLGKAIHVVFNEYITWGNNGRLVNYFEGLGFECDSANYVAPADSSLIISSISNGSPVLAQANSINTGVGHAFLIDAWRQSKTKYTYTYEWVPDVVNPGETIAVPPEIIIVYSAPTARFFSMNWGEGENYNNSWYSVMLSWEGFDLNRRIYYNFRRN